MENHRREKKTYSFSTSVNGSREASGLSREVEVKIQPEEMIEDIASHTANSLLGYTRKDGVPDLLKYSGSNPCGSV